MYMARHAPRKDLNHREIVTAFEQLRCFVLDLSAAGNGLPDLLVGCRHRWYPVEIKSNTSYGRKGLNRLQERIHQQTDCSYQIVRTVDDVIALVKTWTTN